MAIIITGPDGPISNPAEVSSNGLCAENTKDVFTFTANVPVTWSIAAWPGNEGEEDFFTINPSTGLLSFKNAPDYENPLDLSKKNSYDVLVVATDANGTTTYQGVDVYVTDVVEDTDEEVNLETKHIISTNPYYLDTLDAIKKNNNEVTFFIDNEGTSTTWGYQGKGYLPINAASISDNLTNWI